MGVENKHICVCFFAELAIKCELFRVIIYILLHATPFTSKPLALYAFLLLPFSQYSALLHLLIVIFLVSIFFQVVQNITWTLTVTYTHTCAILLKIYIFAAVLATFPKHAQKIFRRPKRKLLGFSRIYIYNILKNARTKKYTVKNKMIKILRIFLSLFIFLI